MVLMFMNKRYFFRSLLNFLIPVVISLLALSALTAAIVFFFSRDITITNNLANLESLTTNMELILTELDSLTLSFGSTQQLESKYMTQLHKERLEYQDYAVLSNLRGFLRSPAYAREYIESIYVYYPNPYGRFLTADRTLAMLSAYDDVGWFDSYQLHSPHRKIWTERRVLGHSAPGIHGTQLITIYQMLPNKGVIVLNLNEKYIGENIAGQKAYSDQSIYVLNSSNEILLRSSSGLPDSQIAQALAFSPPPSATPIQFYEDRHSLYYQTYLARYEWRFISVISKASFYSLSSAIISTLLLMLPLVLAVGIALAFFSTRRDFRHIHQISDMLDAAKDGTLPAALPPPSSNLYNDIMQKIIRNFLEKNYLKVQLSERKYRLRSMEMLALQSQISPHFLYNTLETISWKVRAMSGGSSPVNDIIQKLSDILSFSLDSKENCVPLSMEIENTHNYISILQFRNPNKYHVEWTVPQDVLDVPIVKLTLQPLVENAIYHGLNERESPGHIHITMEKKEPDLLITVKDNGVGIPPEKLAALRDQLKAGVVSSTHIGLFNTNKRLALAYGSQYALSIASEENQSTTVSIVIPLHPSPAELPD